MSRWSIIFCRSTILPQVKATVLNQRFDTMKHCSSYADWRPVLACALIFCYPATVNAHASEPESIPSGAIEHYPFATGSAVRKNLPSADCTYCPGPSPCVPCNAIGGGFLYYRTYPWDDDCLTGFDDCPHGECGQLAVSMSRAWIEHHKKCLCRLGVHKKQGCVETPYK